MATPFETHDTILTQEQADHINERHVHIIKHPQTSKFWLTFNLSSTLALLSHRTWESSPDIKLVEEGWKQHHGHYYLYVFALGRVIGRDPEGFPAKHIAIYYSQKQEGAKWEIISAYPYTASYDAYFLSKRRRSRVF